MLTQEEQDLFTKTMDNIMDEIKQLKMEADAGGGFVKVLINYTGDILKITCEDNPYIKDDIPILLDLVRLAYNSAKNKLVDRSAEIIKNYITDAKTREEILGLRNVIGG